MKNPRICLLFFCFSLIFCPLSAQKESARVAGYVVDSFNMERLIGASIFQKSQKRYSRTNEYGFFAFETEKEDSIVLETSYVGYRPKKTTIYLSKDTIVYIKLHSAATLQEVEIKSARDGIKGTDGSVLLLNSKQIKALPRLLGEADALRAFQLMPGVQSGSEGSSALYVRGGSPDQNLIILDDIPLYFVNHLGGFLSVIDANSISSIKLYKGGFPSRYAGRLSSILDIRLKDGNMKKWDKSFSAGILSSRASISGPIVKGKSSVLVTVRRSNFDYITRLKTLFQGKEKFSAGFWFYDATLKANWNIGKKDRLLLSFYGGMDDLFLRQRQQNTVANEEFTTTSKVSNRWGNAGVGLRWNHIFSESLFGNLAVSYTGFRYTNGLEAQRYLESEDSLVSSFSNALRSKIQDISTKGTFEWHRARNLVVRFGATAILHRFRQPGTEFSQTGINDVSVRYGGDYLASFESGIFGEADGSWGNKVDYNAGLHFAALQVGQSWFLSPQPRLNIVYKAAERLTIKGSYARMTQNLHLLSNAGAGLPTDLWVPTTPSVRPATSDQVEVGMSTDIASSGILIELEGYYKKMKHLIEFQQGASFTSSGGDWQEKVEKNGTGVAYGIELLVRKTSPKVEGWVSYTLSKNQRKFENLNQGHYFPYKFDRTHVFHLVGIYRINKRCTMSGTWTFETGQAITLPSASYQIETFGQSGASGIYGFNPGTAYLFTGRNNFRLPDYHRLDIAFNLTKNIKRKARAVERIWSIGVYNLYNQQNPYFVFYDQNKQQQTKLYQVTLFPFLPFANLEYNF